MNKLSIKKFATTILEPFALGLLALLFILPSLTVINLEPITKKIKEYDVLGVSSSTLLSVNIIGGTHEIFKIESIEDVEGVYTYTTSLTRREADRYSKPILELINKKEEETVLEIYGNTQLPTQSNISMIINDQVYKLQSPSGDNKTQKITLLPNQKYIVYLVVESFSDIQFEEEFQLTIKELQF